MKKQLLLGTINQEKITLLKSALKKFPLKLVELKNIGVFNTAIENGKSPEENGEIKAQKYYTITKIPTITLDVSLTIEKLSSDKQPGIFVRRFSNRNKSVNSDLLLLNHYSEMIKKIGGESRGVFHVALALIVSQNQIFKGKYSLQALFISQISDSVIPGAPLSSMMIDPISKKYYSEMKPEERPDIKFIKGFIQQHLNDF